MYIYLYIYIYSYIYIYMYVSIYIYIYIYIYISISIYIYIYINHPSTAGCLPSTGARVASSQRSPLLHESRGNDLNLNGCAADGGEVVGEVEGSMIY